MTAKSPLETRISYGVGLITKSRYANSTLYMVENIGNIKDEIDGRKPAKFIIDLNSEEKSKEIKFYHRGRNKKIATKNGVISLSIKCGDAIFIEFIR